MGWMRFLWQLVLMTLFFLFFFFSLAHAALFFFGRPPLPPFAGDGRVLFSFSLLGFPQFMEKLDFWTLFFPLNYSAFSRFPLPNWRWACRIFFSAPYFLMSFPFSFS